MVLGGSLSRKPYPDALRRIGHVDTDTGKKLIFLTNNFTLPANVAAQLYRCRWQVELFFKWMKPHLRIKAFYGTSDNAVKTQIWIAISTYVLIARLRKRLMLAHSPYTILQIMSITLFETPPILQALSPPPRFSPMPDDENQLYLQGI